MKETYPLRGRWAGANQPVHWFLGGQGLGIQQGTCVWVGLPKLGEVGVCEVPHKSIVCFICLMSIPCTYLNFICSKNELYYPTCF